MLRLRLKHEVLLPRIREDVGEAARAQVERPHRAVADLHQVDPVVRRVAVALAGEQIDHVDVLLTAPVKSGTDADKQTSSLSTQTTLQNVEIYRIGDDELNTIPSGSRADNSNSQSSGSNGFSSSTPASATGRRALGLLIGHQDAVTMKFVKDAGGTLDLVTRSAEDQQVVPTDGVTLDSLTDRFRFRIPQPVQPTDSVKAQSR